ncbi:hypothetical protein MMC22_005869 [Lobaria immixta]|nr:hypothetical protein [Lobaria immixta]
MANIKHGTASFVAEPESISPTTSPSLDGKASRHSLGHTKQRLAAGANRLLGKPALNEPSSSIQSPTSTGAATDPRVFEDERYRPHSRHHSHEHHSSHVMSQVSDWLQNEKAKKAGRRSKRQESRSKIISATDSLKSSLSDGRSDSTSRVESGRGRAASDMSDSSVDLESLEKILAGLNATPKDEKWGFRLSHRSSSKRQLLRKSSGLASSDTDYLDGDAVIPAADVVLDNSKTLGYSGGEADSKTNLLDSQKRRLKEKEAWLLFKNEIVRLAHTLRLKGWRRVPLNRGGEIDVERLSGALTNAVYVVSPPADLSHTPSSRLGSATSRTSEKGPSPPPKLLLRIYGPNVEHLINRESELQILRRLRRKKIGPSLLGTFTNGRFEQFFYARTLTAADLRIPETSKQIAKRMRELHDGVELLDEERELGPYVWQNWDKWVERCEEVIPWLDGQINSGMQEPVKSRSEMWKKRGLVCGTEWADFRKTVEQYRRWLNEQYGGAASVKQELVFAHNDTQYGNLLRLIPPGESPLLAPANEHKQLVVIDFEYASANVPGLEFANHFTEWCYNYHDPEKSYALNETVYPTPEEQRRFLRAYIQHRPFESLTPAPTQELSSSSASFVLDSRAPPAQIAKEEAARDEVAEAKIQHLMHEAQIWRVANSAHWIAWGIVQAKVPGMDEALKVQKRPISEAAGIQDDAVKPSAEHPTAESSGGASQDKKNEGGEEEEEEQEQEEFDYLAYAQDRAMFFWGDVLQLGFVKQEQLPAALLGKIKRVEY